VARRGHIYSWERVWYPIRSGLKDACPYLVVVVELTEASGLRHWVIFWAIRTRRFRSAPRWKRCSRITSTKVSRCCSGVWFSLDQGLNLARRKFRHSRERYLSGPMTICPEAHVSAASGPFRPMSDRLVQAQPTTFPS
jgi:hypothetical protein